MYIYDLLHVILQSLLIVAGLHEGDTDRGGERQEFSGVQGGDHDAEVLQGSRAEGAKQPVWNDHRQRRCPLDYHRSGHLERAGQAVYETGRLRGGDTYCYLLKFARHQ